MFFGLFKKKEPSLLEKYDWVVCEKKQYSIILRKKDDINWRHGINLIQLFDDDTWYFYNAKSDEVPDLDLEGTTINEQDLIAIENCIIDEF